MVRKVAGGSVGLLVHACLKMMTDLEEEEDWAVSDEPQEEDNDSNAVVAESALDRLACGLGGKTVFPHILQLTPAMLQVGARGRGRSIGQTRISSLPAFKPTLEFLLSRWSGGGTLTQC
jgi:hypothetical protein